MPSLACVFDFFGVFVCVCMCACVLYFIFLSMEQFVNITDTAPVITPPLPTHTHTFSQRPFSHKEEDMTATSSCQKHGLPPAQRQPSRPSQQSADSSPIVSNCPTAVLLPGRLALVADVHLGRRDTRARPVGIISGDGAGGRLDAADADTFPERSQTIF